MEAPATGTTRSALQKFLHAISDEAHETGGKDLPPVTDEEIAAFDRKKYKGFDRVGYARPLGGWFYQFFFVLLSSGVIVVLYSYELGILYPEVESRAYVDVAGKLYSILFFAFNVPTNFAIERWVADFRIKNPKKMVQYISFYMWYQMMTGLILITSTSLYTFWIVTEGKLAYTAFLMLVLIVREYPACLGVFMHTIMGLQKFDTQSQIGFMESIWSKGLEIVFVLLGRFWLGSNPAIGALMGTAIGHIIGTYVDDFVTAATAALFLRRILKPMGVTLTDILRPNFTRDVAVNSFVFGIKRSIPGLFSTILGFFVFFAWYDAVPAYATYVVLNNLADSIANISKQSQGIESTGAFAEAINNGKYKLAQYLIASTFKYYGFFTIGIACIVIGFMPVILQVMLVTGGAANYLLAIPFIAPNIIATLLEQPSNDAGRILTMGNKPLFNSLTEIINSIISNTVTMVIIGTGIPQTYGLSVLIWIIPFSGMPGGLTKLFLNWWYINKYICKVGQALRSIAWQAFVAPIIPGAVTIAMGSAWYVWAFPPLAAVLTPIGAVIVSVLFAFVGGLMFNFIILYGLVGGWCKHSLEVFKEAVDISGPSKILFWPVYKLTALFSPRSRLFNRFPMEHEGAVREMKELMIQREKTTAMAKARVI